MPTTTGTQNLTIPSSTDAVIDQWSYHAQMALQMEQRFNSHDVDVARASPFPTAVVDCTVAGTYPLNTANQFDRIVKFDSIATDTGSMVDLETTPQALTPQETGYYRFGVYVKLNASLCTGPGYVELFTSARGNSGTQVGWSSGNGPASSSVEVALTGSTSVWASGDIEITSLGLSVGYPLIVFIGSACATSFVTQFARMWLYKTKDLG